ncbi:MAG: hypothetical protein ACR2RF_24920 [Geminicoccaceae bacterium]
MIWRIIADLGTWLLELGVAHGAYDGEYSREQMEADYIDEQAYEREQYEIAKAEGYHEGRRDERLGL